MINFNDKNGDVSLFKMLAIGLAGIFFIIFWVAVKPYKIVSAGERGVKTHFGAVVGTELPEGIHFFIPIMNSIDVMSIKTVSESYNTQAYTKDIQQSALSVTLNFNLTPTKVTEMYATVGKDYKETLIDPIVAGAIKNIIGVWDAVDLVANRDKATKQIEKIISEKLGEVGVTVTNFNITNIDFAEEFERSVEAKVVAAQRALEALNKTKQIEQEAAQKVISAKAEAESMRIRAEALSQNKNLVQYEAVQKWDGKLPVYSMGDATPIISIGKKDEN